MSHTSKLDLSRVHNLIHLYAELVDEGDFDALGNLFSRGSLTFSPGDLVLRGGREVSDFYKKTVIIDADTASPRTVHRVYNTIVTSSGDGWHARSRYDVSQFDAEQGVSVIALGRYFDTFKAVGDECFFHTRKVLSEYLGDAQNHLTDLDFNYQKSLNSTLLKSHYSQ